MLKGLKQEKSMRENMSRVIIPVKERIEKCVKLIEVHQTGRTSQVTYVTMVPRVGNETLRPLGVATGNALSVTRSEDTYVKTPPVGRRQPMTSLPACHNISATGRIHHQLLRLKLASEAWLES